MTVVSLVTVVSLLRVLAVVSLVTIVCVVTVVTAVSARTVVTFSTYNPLFQDSRSLPLDKMLLPLVSLETNISRTGGLEKVTDSYFSNSGDVSLINCFFFFSDIQAMGVVFQLHLCSKQHSHKQ